MGACFSTATLVGLAANILQQQSASMAQVTPAIAVNYLQQFYSDGIYGWVLRSCLVRDPSAAGSVSAQLCRNCGSPYPFAVCSSLWQTVPLDNVSAALSSEARAPWTLPVP
jgi:hypothetical protein